MYCCEQKSVCKRNWKDHIIGSGQKFKDASAFRLGLYQFSIANGFVSKFKKNSKSFISVDCKAEGCPWHLTALKMRSTEFMVVGTFINVHNHCAQDAIQSRPSSKSKFVAAIILEKMILQPDTTPHKIHAALESECGIPVTYQQAWACKEQNFEDRMLAPRPYAAAPCNGEEIIALNNNEDGILEPRPYAAAPYNINGNLGERRRVATC